MCLKNITSSSIWQQTSETFNTLTVRQTKYCDYNQKSQRELKIFNNDVPFFILTLTEIYDCRGEDAACLMFLKMCQTFLQTSFI